jgi:hypothetical protein
LVNEEGGALEGVFARDGVLGTGVLDTALRVEPDAEPPVADWPVCWGRRAGIELAGVRVFADGVAAFVGVLGVDTAFAGVLGAAATGAFAGALGVAAVGAFVAPLEAAVALFADAALAVAGGLAVTGVLPEG